jgi:hypothetical protein
MFQPRLGHPQVHKQLESYWDRMYKSFYNVSSWLKCQNKIEHYVSIEASGQIVLPWQPWIVNRSAIKKPKELLQSLQLTHNVLNYLIILTTFKHNKTVCTFFLTFLTLSVNMMMAYPRLKRVFLVPYFTDYKTHFFLRKIASKIQVLLIIKMVKMLFF